MFFLLRAAFWLSLVVMLLPTDGSLKDGERVSAFETVGFARSVISDLGGICERSPDVCETGGKLARTFGAKARYGAEKLYDYLDGTFTEDTKSPPRGTLTAKDLEPDWRSPDKKG